MTVNEWQDYHHAYYEQHRDKYLARAKEYYSTHKEKMRKYRSEYSRATRQKRKELGICTECGKAPARAGYSSCWACALKASEKNRKRKRRKSGVQSRVLQEGQG